MLILKVGANCNIDQQVLAVSSLYFSILTSTLKTLTFMCCSIWFRALSYTADQLKWKFGRFHSRTQSHISTKSGIGIIKDVLLGNNQKVANLEVKRAHKRSFFKINYIQSFHKAQLLLCKWTAIKLTSSKSIWASVSRPVFERPLKNYILSELLLNQLAVSHNSCA